MRHRIRLSLVAAACSLACAGSPPPLPGDGSYGPDPVLPPPDTSLVPPMNIAPARGWAPGEQPISAPGFTVQRFAVELYHPRSLYVLPNGDVLVAETSGPPSEAKGVKGRIMAAVKERAGSDLRARAAQHVNAWVPQPLGRQVLTDAIVKLAVAFAAERLREVEAERERQREAVAECLETQS